MHHSRVLLNKRSSPLICRAVASQLLVSRAIFTASSSNPSTPWGPSPALSRSNNGENKRRKRSGLNFLKSVVSGTLAVGSSLGFLYWSSGPGNIPGLAFADSRIEAAPEEKKSKFLFGDAYRKKVFFKYEKRIRTQSPPEKVFEYFSSVRSQNGEILMTPADLMRAIVPVFPPTESGRVREGSLKGEWGPGELHCAPSDFFMLFDTNNDGLISFAEYIFFVTLLSIPESSFSVAFKMFDVDNNGEIDREEFKKVMALMRNQNRHVARHSDGLRTGLKVSSSVENGGLLEYFFGKDGNECLHLDKFVQFLRDLHDEIVRLEFCHYDHGKQGTISAKDFALSMVASADMKHINKFLKRVEELDEEHNLKDIRITYEEFKSFAELRRRLRALSLAIFTYGKVNGLLTKQDFKRAAYQVCGINLADSVVDMVFYIFDTNRDGSLSSDEFLKVLQRREKNVAVSRDGGFVGLISCWLDCSKNCSYSKVLF